MRRLADHEVAFVALAAVVVVYVAYEGAKYMAGNADLYAPQKQPAPTTNVALANLGIAVDGYSHICQPEEHHAGYVYTPHRYPRTVGGEITNSIHHGFSSMRVPNVQDVQWIISPPSEVAW